MTAPWIEAVGLGKDFAATGTWWWAPAPAPVRAVADVGFGIARGRTLGLVGESGSGKTTLGRLMVGLLTPSAGEVRVGGTRLGPAHRRQVQMVFQDPYASLNPRWSVGAIVGEPLVLQRPALARAERRERVAELLVSVGLSAADATRHPHQFSGGQRQRISIARAMATDPGFLVCDEPTSALDVSVQAQVLNLLKDQQARRNVSCLFISHNLAVVRFMSDDVGVLYGGRLVELAGAADVFGRPRHPYTRLLLAAVPGHGRGRPAPLLVGEPADPRALPTGCAFHPRCPLATDRCRRERPDLRAVGGTRVACHAVEEGRD